MSAIKSVTLTMGTVEGQSTTMYTLNYYGGNTSTGQASKDFIWQLVSLFYPQEMQAMAQGQAAIAAANAPSTPSTPSAPSTPSTTGVDVTLPTGTVKVKL